MGVETLKPRTVTALFLLLYTVLLLFFGCGKARITELKKERLFSVPIGEKEEQVGVVREKNGRFHGPSILIFKNGFFYLVDSVNQKILKITTPGDIILTISKGRMESSQDENILRTKQRTLYDFSQIGLIAVDNENCLWVEDKFLEAVPETEEIDLFSDVDTFDEGTGELYKSYILKFDRLGRFVFRLGKDGINTEPFYYIYKMAVDRDGNLTVLTADDEWQRWTVFRFDVDGNPINSCELESEQIAGVIEEGDGQELFIMDLYPVCNENLLLFWVSLYETRWDTKELKKEEDLWGEEIEIEDLESVPLEEEEKKQQGYERDLLFYKLFYFDLHEKAIERTYAWENKLANQASPTSEFFGIDAESNGFLWKYISNTKSVITIFRPNGSIVARRSFIFEDDGVWTNTHVDEDGSVSALKIDRAFVHFYRWRSDRLIMPGGDEKFTLLKFFKGKIEGFKNANR